MRPVLARIDIPGLPLLARGRVRDLYDLDSQLLVVTTDRVAINGQLLPEGMPDHGRVLNQLSAFWFDFLQNTAPSHYISTDLDQILALLGTFGVKADPELLQGSSMLVNRARPIPIRVVVHGYLTGPTWTEYQASGTAAGQALPADLQEGDRLAEPILTPLSSAPDGSESPLTWEQMVHMVEPGHLTHLFDQALAVYEHAARHALDQGVIVAAAEFEFGVFQGMTILIGECLTPHSARLWDAQVYRPGRAQVEFGRQFLLDALERAGWDGRSLARGVLVDVLQRTAARYRELFQRLTGTHLE
jgi:phosphoribosylaminoimidazole-succinocarboxamide synthase